MGGQFFQDRFNDDERDIRAIRSAIDLGLTHIDTAEMYASGHTETLVGRAIRSYDRGRLFLTTKLWPLHARFDDALQAAKNSMRRLGTSYLDLYLLHGPNYDVPLKESMRALDTLVEEGFTRFIGLSNFSIEELAEAQSLAKNKIVNHQVKYNLIDREPELSGLIEYCRKNGVLVTAYQPIKRGELAKPGYRVLDSLAAKYKKTQAQIAINWLISQPGVITIPKTSRLNHLKEIIGSVGWRLSADDARALGESFLSCQP
jgi:diketogulonate reductase-like aldo/keto reductase